MGWEPIEISEEQVRAFAGKAVELCESLNQRERLMLQEIITRAGGDGGHPDTVASEPATGRYGNLDRPGGEGNTSSVNGANQSMCDGFATMLAGVWEPGTVIAPLNSGDILREGGGTID
jgi:hypothetical protein